MSGRISSISVPTMRCSTISSSTSLPRSRASSNSVAPPQLRHSHNDHFWCCVLRVGRCELGLSSSTLHVAFRRTRFPESGRLLRFSRRESSIGWAPAIFIVQAVKRFSIWEILGRLDVPYPAQPPHSADEPPSRIRLVPVESDLG